jgi:hypothetical protein
MIVGTRVKAVRNHNRVEEGKLGEVINPPKGHNTFSKADQWVWVKFFEIHSPKLMKLTEVEMMPDYTLSY